MDPHHLYVSPILQKALSFDMHPGLVCELHSAISSQGQLLNSLPQQQQLISIMLASAPTAVSMEVEKICQILTL